MASSFLRTDRRDSGGTAPLILNFGSKVYQRSTSPLSLYTPGTHYTGGWMGTGAVMGVGQNGKVSYPCQESSPGLSKPQISH